MNPFWSVTCFVTYANNFSISHGPDGRQWLTPSLLTPQDQQIPGCSGVICPLSEFRQALAAYALPLDRYKQRCDEGATSQL